jgi:hypothetical protein
MDMRAFQGYVENGHIIPIDMPRIPDGFQVIITVLDKKPITKEEIDAMLENSVTHSLLGSVPRTDVSLEEMRIERLSKYERAD